MAAANTPSPLSILRRWPDRKLFSYMDSKLAAARLDFMELLAGDGAVFSRLLQGPK